VEIILGRLMIIATVFLPILFASAFFVYGVMALWERVRGHMPEELGAHGEEFGKALAGNTGEEAT
jgi:hypothetical protein